MSPNEWGKNRLLVTIQPNEFEKWPVEVQDLRNLTHHCVRNLYGIYPKVIKRNRKMSTCNWLDLETLGFCSKVSPNTTQPYCWRWRSGHGGWRGGIITYKCTSYPSNIKTCPTYRFVVNSSQMTWTTLIWGFLGRLRYEIDFKQWHVGCILFHGFYAGWQKKSAIIPSLHGELAPSHLLVC